MTEYVVIGAGPAGASVAIRLAQAGREVVLVDRAAPPKDKLCGEFLSPESSRDLEALGLGPDLAELGAPRIEHARFTAPSGRVARFRLPGAGRGLSRRELDRRLWERAQAVGVITRVGEVVDVRRRGDQVAIELRGEGAPLRARRLVAAHGRHRRLDRALEPTSEPQRGPDLRRYAGIKRHHQPSDRVSRELAGHVEIHVFEGGYCGMSHVEGGLVNVCALVDTGWLRRQSDRTWPALFAAMARKQPRLEARRRELEPLADRPMIAVSAIDLTRSRPVAGPALQVGDAAAVIAPLAGDGQAMALSGARRLADLLLDGPPEVSIDRLADRWTRTFDRAYRNRLAWARWLQSTLWRPSRAEALVWTASRVSGIPEALARWTREPAAAPSTSLDVGPVMRDS